jgi:hypothetical protein
VGGYAAGTAWLALCIATSESLRRRSNNVRNSTDESIANPDPA